MCKCVFSACVWCVHTRACTGSHIQADAWRTEEDVNVLLCVCLIWREDLLLNLELSWWLARSHDPPVSQLLPHSAAVTGMCTATPGFLFLRIQIQVLELA